MNAPKRDDIADGNLLRSWGGSGQGYDWPQNKHGIFVDKDGSVWSAATASRRSARNRLRNQIESEDSRSWCSTTVPSAVAARAPAGNCSTVARWP
jgi:hypothetical protein